jgi:glycosyltransferase involved in cell wall biosynthesis
MRVAYFMDTPRWGGAEEFLASLAAGACTAGHDVTVISPQRFLLDRVEAVAPPVQLVPAGDTSYFSARPGLATIAALARTAPEIRRVISARRPDVLHVNNGGYPGSDLARLATIVARLAGRPKCVLSVHNAAWDRDASIAALQTLVDAFVWRATTAVHTTSEYVARTMTEVRGMPARLGRHIPYGVPEPGGGPEAVAELRSALVRESDRLLVGIVAATGEPHKGHRILVEAIASADVAIDVVVVGPDPGDEFGAQLASSPLRGSVTRVGPVPPPEVGPYLRTLDLLVVPSTAFESLPLVVLEAMAAGKPVFASRLAGIPEAVVDGETGRLFPPGDVEELSVLLSEAVANPANLSRMGRAAHERWRRHFSLTKMTESMLALYEELAGRTRRTSA